MAITQLTNIPNPNTQNAETFTKNTTELFNTQLPRFIDETNTVGSDLSGKWSNVKYWTNLTEGYKNDSLNYRNDSENAKNTAVSARDRAESAANRAEAVVVPTEATYNINDLETALNGLLTQLVAQQAQINILINN